MTGIGFLGSDIIFKEGLTVRSLTTAASIWITAALGILYGVGFHYPALLGTGATLGVLAALCWFERRIPSQFFFQFSVRYTRDKMPALSELLQFLKNHGFTLSAMSYRLISQGANFEYETVIRSNNQSAARKLANELLKQPDIVKFNVHSMGE